MGLLGNFIGGLVRNAPKIGRVIGQIADTSRKVGQVIDTGRKMGTIANQAMGGRLTANPIGKKIDEVTQKVGHLTGQVASGADRAGAIHSQVVSSLTR